MPTVSSGVAKSCKSSSEAPTDEARGDCNDAVLLLLFTRACLGPLYGAIATPSRFDTVDNIAITLTTAA